jgi:uncharacterized protein YdhG (YjbR/CyaY superfamily)
METPYTTIDGYIKQFSKEIQSRLKDMYNIIKEVVPKETVEKISWQMPTFYLNGNLVHFAAHTNHIGFYPGASGIENFKNKFEDLKYSKGAVQFNNNKILPKELIQEIVKFRISENMK